MEHGDTDTKLDLSQCDKEPIAYINSIQKGAYLIAFNCYDFYLVAYSENISDIYDVSNADASTKLEEIITNSMADKIKQSLPFLSASALYYFYEEINGEPYAFSLSRSDADTIILAAEANKCHQSIGEYGTFIQSYIDSFEKKKTLTTEFYNQCAEFFKGLLGYDRVMVYCFHSDDHGEVVGEAKNADIKALLHNHFPASDIPKAARDLYIKNKTRLVININDKDVPLVYMDKKHTKALNLSAIDMRTLSPIHKEYLNNMGVVSSLSISIIVEQKLWGLIACHHHRPISVEFSVRRQCEFMSAFLAKHIEATCVKDSLEYSHYTQYRYRKFQRELLQKQLAFDELTPSDLTLGVIDSDYIAIVNGDDFSSDLQTITIDFIKQIIDASGVDYNNSVFSSHRFSETYFKGQYNDICSGVMVACISKDSRRFIIWLRSSVTKKTTWGGDPNKPAKIADGKQRISPRTSFQSWIEVVRGESEEWTNKEKQFAEDITLTLRLVP